MNTTSRPTVDRSISSQTANDRELRRKFPSFKEASNQVSNLHVRDVLHKLKCNIAAGQRRRPRNQEIKEYAVQEPTYAEDNKSENIYEMQLYKVVEKRDNAVIMQNP